MNTTKNTHGYREPPNGCAHSIMFFFAVLIIAIMCMLSSCKVVEYVEVEKIKKEIEYRDRTLWDSIYIDNKVTVYQKGDTIYRDSIRFVDKWHVRIDSVEVERIDSVPYPVEVEIITNELTSWQKKQIWGFWLLIVFILGFIFLKIKSII